ncbi:MAG: hypothetical protein ACREQ5_04490, partial [Candidatus Dormibacteria bacterium]
MLVERALVYDASNRKDIRRAEKASAQVQRTRLDFLHAAMGTPQGRAWFHELLSVCHLFADPFSGQALTEAYLKGERNVGLRIFAEILEYCPDQYILMMKEASHARATVDSTAERTGSQDGDWGVEDTNSTNST